MAEPLASENVAEELKRKYIKRPASSSSEHENSKKARVRLIEKWHDVAIAADSTPATRTPVRIGSDCTGLGTEAIALKLGGIAATHVFGSEINKATRKIYREVHGTSGAPVHHDVLGRKAAPSCDLYVAGPPCQAWSGKGKGQGLDDLAGRGLVFYGCLQYIRERRPRAVVLENVVGLKSRHPGEFLDILSIIEGLQYHVTWSVMDAVQHGLPQRRPRIYIVVIKTRSCAHAFSFPQALHVKPKIEKFLDNTPLREYRPGNKTSARNLDKARATLKQKGVDAEATALVDVFAAKNFENLGVGVSPCITASRAKAGGFLINNQHRMTTTYELGRLQGFTTAMVDKMVAASGVDSADVRTAIGNAMSVNVLVRLLPRVAYAAGLLADKPKDMWKHLTSKGASRCKVLPDDIYRQDI